MPTNCYKGRSQQNSVTPYNKNDIHHLFGRSGDIPTGHLDKYGTPEAALKELQKSAQPIADKNYHTGAWITVQGRSILCWFDLTVPNNGVERYSLLEPFEGVIK